VGQERSEKVLMQWYLMRTGQARAPYASFQWDVLLNQALGDIKRKFSVEKINRGGLLFDFEKHAIAFGWMYFFLIFIDRWVTVFTGNGIFVFIADGIISADYTFGIGWATIFMLLCAGTFELNLASISYAETSWESARLGLYDKEGLVNQRRRQKSRFYRAEFLRFLSAVLLVFAITSACVLALGANKTTNAFIFYAVGCFGYFGLLLGLFHKLFMANKDAAVNRILMAACVIGLGTGIGLVVAFKDPMWAVAGIVAGGWVFGLGCALLQRRNLRLHRGVYLSPSLMSSGQSWYGPDGLAMDPAVREKVLYVICGPVYPGPARPLPAAC
jgi:hypothetical protein